MALPIILETRDVIAGGRYLQEVRISTFPPSSELPEGIRYSLCPVDLASGEVVRLDDVHRGKSHHRHLSGTKITYRFVDEDTLVDDFVRDITLILEGKLWAHAALTSGFALALSGPRRFAMR